MKTAQDEFREIQHNLNSLALRMFDLNLQADNAKLIDLVRMLETTCAENNEHIQQLEKANKILNRENAHLRAALNVSTRPDPDEIPF